MEDQGTAYLTTHPASAQKFPGTNANMTGIKILGRTFRIGDNTVQDMDIKIGIAWSKFNKFRHILKAQNPLPHRLRILKSCVGCFSWEFFRISEAQIFSENRRFFAGNRRKPQIFRRNRFVPFSLSLLVPPYLGGSASLFGINLESVSCHFAEQLQPLSANAH